MILKLTFAHPLSVGYLIKSNLQAARGIRILFKTEAPHKRPGKQDKTRGTGVAAGVTHTKGGKLRRKGGLSHGAGGHGGSEKLSDRVSTRGWKICKGFPEQSRLHFCKLNFLRGL